MRARLRSVTDDGLAEHRDRLYAADPGEFVGLRKELSSEAKQAGDAALAKRIAALRKPTAAASIVNRFALADDTVAPRVRELGDRLRRAQGDPGGIDTDLLRELTTQRRKLVHDLSAAALDAGGSSPGAAVRDEVQQTLDAAVADPDVADRLGRLTHAEQWSGFGTVAVLDPAPRPARGGKAPTKQPAPARPRRARGPSAAEQSLRRAEAAVAEADEQVGAAEADEARARTHVDTLTTRLEQLQTELGAAREQADEAHAALRAARSRRRDAEKERRRAAGR